MSSIAKTSKRSKKTRRLGSVQVLRPDQYEAFDVETKVECLFVPSFPWASSMFKHSWKRRPVCWLAPRYTRKASQLPGRRHGSNPGSVRLAGQQVPLRIPLVRPMGRQKFR